ncbi:tetratricopeptide repeat protein [Deltaproteobacteria bacterium OttesenSCG-928-K17]|nr:tetratricopeptide repeat protein [Deltaproteobacteria bacterium OttesenSCG-928-K17]
MGVAFEDLVGHHGQIIQMLPMDRVIVNLGRLTGAASGQVFLISAPQDKPGVEPEYKGEATIFEVQDSYSLAYISGHKQARGIVAGDRLTFSRRDFETANAAVSGGADLPGFLAGLPTKEDFMARLADFTGKPLALALARLDDYDKTISMFGREEGLRLLSFVFEKAASELPETRLKALWQPDTLVLAWPGASAEDIRPAAHRAAADLKEQGPVSFGLVFAGGGGESAEGLVDDGCKALREAAFSGPGQVAVFGPLALNISGDRLFEEGDLSGAVKEYERGLAIASEPRRGDVSSEADGSRLTTHLNLLNSLGVCFGRMGDSNQALGVFEKIVALDPDNMMAHYNAGYTHLLAGRLNEAEELLGRAAELAPNNFETLFHLGKTALELGHLDKALAALKKAGDLENARPSVYRLLGEVLLLAHDHQGAQAAFKKAVKASPNDAYSLSALGFLFMDVSNDLPVAESLLRKSVEIDPTNSLYRQRLGRLLFSLGQYDEAEHHLKTATEYGSRAPEVHYHLGRLAEEAGRNEEALAHFRAALAEDPAYQPALEKVGD